MTRCLIHAKDFHVQCEYCAMAGRTAAAALEVERWGSAWWWEVDEMECKHGKVIELKTDCRPCYLAEYRRVNGRADTERIANGRDVEMTFDEIGAVIGETAQNTYAIYKSAVKKLRRKRFALRQLVELAQSKSQRSESRYSRMQTERI